MKNKIETASGIRVAKILGITDRRVRALASEGVFEKVGRGTYDLSKTVQAYINYQVDLSKQRFSTGTLLEEQTRLTKEKADEAAMKNEVMRGELIPVAVTTDVLQKLVVAARTKMLALPSQIKTRYPDIPLGVIAQVEEYVRNCLQEIAESELPERYRKGLDRYHKNMDPAAEA